MKSVVVDASAALGWVLESQKTRTADEFLRASGDRELVAPAIFPWEIHNAMLSFERRGLVSRQSHDRAILALDSYGIRIEEPVSAGEVRAQMAFAREVGLSLFDSAYLSQALAWGCGLASRDGGLLRAAAGAGVECHDLRDEMIP